MKLYKCLSILFIIAIVLYFSGIFHFRDESSTSESREIIQLIDNFNFDEAIGISSNFIKKQPKNPEGYYLHGEAIREKLFFSGYKELDKYELNSYANQSESSYNKSLQLDETQVKSRIGLAKLYLYLRKYDKALKYFLLVEEMGVAQPDVYLDIARIYNKLGDEKTSNYYYSLAKGDIKYNFTKINKIEKNDILNVLDQSYNVESIVYWKFREINGFVIKNWPFSAIEDLIYDTYKGSLILISNKSSIAEKFDFNDRIKKDVIDNSNKSKLFDYGVEITDLEMKIGK